MSIVKVLTGTNMKRKHNMLNGIFGDLSWWSDNIETAAHYYEGAILELTIRLDDSRKPYVRQIDDSIKDYTYGMEIMSTPKDAKWFVFSKEYIQDNTLSIEEVYPDLSKFE